MSVKNGGPAFPTVDANRAEDYGTYGMSLRDYFAAKALQGMCADPTTAGTNGMDLAEECYQLADAMLVAREVLR